MFLHTKQRRHQAAKIQFEFQVPTTNVPRTTKVYRAMGRFDYVISVMDVNERPNTLESAKSLGRKCRIEYYSPKPKERTSWTRITTHKPSLKQWWRYV